MGKHLSDYETAKTLKEIGFNFGCLTFFYNKDFRFVRNPEYDSILNAEHNETHEEWIECPTWWQIKQWLWDKHQISIEREEKNHSKKGRLFRCWLSTEADVVWQSEWFDSPITTEIEGIKQAIKYLYKK